MGCWHWHFHQLPSYAIWRETFEGQCQRRFVLICFKCFQTLKFKASSRRNLSSHQNQTCLFRLNILSSIKQADYLLLYEQNWLKEGTEGLVLKKPAESSKWKPIPNWQIWRAHALTVRFCIKSLLAFGIKNASSELSVSHCRVSTVMGDGEKQGAMIPFFVVSQNRYSAGFFCTRIFTIFVQIFLILIIL